MSTLFEDAREACRQGNLAEAINLYRQALEQEPDCYKTLNNLATTLEDAGQLDEAEPYLHRAIALNPDEPIHHYNLGHVLQQKECFQEAIDAYRRVLELSPEDVATHFNLGQALCASQQPTAAIAHFQAAEEYGADVARVRRSIGDAYLSLRLLGPALASFRQAVAANPADAAAHFALGTAHEVRGDYQAAAVAFRRSLDLNHSSHAAFEHLARALIQANRRDEARAVVAEWLAEHPEQPVAQHMLATLSGARVPARASDDYVRTVFDAFAPNFDENLHRLDYQAPGLLLAALQPHLETSRERLSVLDLGCGTGLVGPLCRSFSGKLTGVDLSAGMLAKARRRQVYDRLVEAELTAFLAATDETYDVIIAADTLVYFGDLREVLTAARRALSASGLLAFSLEKADAADPGEPYRLQFHGRYCHTPDYVRSTLAAAGLTIRKLEDMTPRKEAGQPVKGLLVLAQSNA